MLDGVYDIDADIDRNGSIQNFSLIATTLNLLFELLGKRLFVNGYDSLLAKINKGWLLATNICWRSTVSVSIIDYSLHLK